MNAFRFYSMGFISIVFLSNCVTWRGPRLAVYKGTHQLPTAPKKVETITLKATEGDSGLAKVIVLPFTNLSKNASYDYLSESLSGTIDAGMASRFEYKRKVTVEEKAFLIRLKSADNRRQMIDAFAKDNDIDIVISGFYTGAEGNFLNIQTEVFEKGKTENLAEIKEKSKADSSLFTVSDTIAQKTVESIVRARR